MLSRKYERRWLLCQRDTANVKKRCNIRQESVKFYTKFLRFFLHERIYYGLIFHIEERTLFYIVKTLHKCHPEVKRNKIIHHLLGRMSTA